MKKLTIFSIGLLFIISNLTACGSSSNGDTKNGTRIEITNETLPDGQKGNEYNVVINVNGGSGEYIYTCESFPQNLSINESGVIQGIIEIDPGDYNLKVIVIDKNYQSNKVERNYPLKIVDVMPDEYEPDDIFIYNFENNENKILPGENKDHTFHLDTDADYMVIDLREVVEGDKIIIKTAQLRIPTDTRIQLYDVYSNLMKDNNDISDNNKYSQIEFICTSPGLYILKIENPKKLTGDYRLSIINAGQLVLIRTETLPDAEQDRLYSSVIQATGGSGEFSYSISSGQLPNGLNINESTGQISGILSALNKSYNFSVNVTDNLNPENYSTKEFSITTFRGLKVFSTLFDSYQLPRPRQESYRVAVVNKQNWNLISVSSFQCGRYIRNYFRVGDIVEIVEEDTNSYQGGNRGIRTIESFTDQSGTNLLIVRLSAPIQLRNWIPYLVMTPVLERLYVDTLFPESSEKRTDRIQFELKFPNGRQTATTIFPCYYNGNTRVDLDPINISSATASDTFVRTYDLPSSGLWRLGIAQAPEWANDPENGKCVVTMSGSSF